MSILKRFKGVLGDVKAKLTGKLTRREKKELYERIKQREYVVKQRIEILELRMKLEKQELRLKQQEAKAKKLEAKEEIREWWKKHKKKTEEEQEEDELPVEIIEGAGYE